MFRVRFFNHFYFVEKNLLQVNKFDDFFNNLLKLFCIAKQQQKFCLKLY